MYNGIMEKWEVRPILDPKFHELPPLQTVYVSVLKDLENTSTAIKSITAIFPGLTHLKRCFNGRLLLAPSMSHETNTSSERRVSYLREEKLRQQLTEKGFDLSLLNNKFEIIELPESAPKTKLQAEKLSELWSLNFDPDPILEKVLDGSIFSENDLDTMEEIMCYVREAAKEAVGNKYCNGAAVIFDPLERKILAISAARVDRQPLWHAAMLAIDLVASLQGGGVFKLDDDDNQESTETRTDDDVDVKEKTPLCYPTSLSSLKIEHHTATIEMRRGLLEGPLNSNPYLCTGYWAFLLMEPCPMCAMALGNSRVREVFYGIANPDAGVLGSKALLHTLPGLNYRVWGDIAKERCKETAKLIEPKMCNVGKSVAYCSL